MGGAPLGVTVDPGRRCVAVTDAAQGGVVVLGEASGAVIVTTAVGPQPFAVAIDRGDLFVASRGVASLSGPPAARASARCRFVSGLAPLAGALPAPVGRAGRPSRVAPVLTPSAAPTPAG